MLDDDPILPTVYRRPFSLESRPTTPDFSEFLPIPTVTESNGRAMRGVIREMGLARTRIGAVEMAGLNAFAQRDSIRTYIAEKGRAGELGDHFFAEINAVMTIPGTSDGGFLSCIFGSSPETARCRVTIEIRNTRA